MRNRWLQVCLPLKGRKCDFYCTVFLLNGNTYCFLPTVTAAMLCIPGRNKFKSAVFGLVFAYNSSSIDGRGDFLAQAKSNRRLLISSLNYSLVDPIVTPLLFLINRFRWKKSEGGFCYIICQNGGGPCLL